MCIEQNIRGDASPLKGRYTQGDLARAAWQAVEREGRKVTAILPRPIFSRTHTPATQARGGGGTSPGD